MANHLSLHRRKFIQAAAATAGAGMLPGRRVLHAADSAVRGNEHFWFRLAPEGPYIDSQRDNKAFGFGDGKIFLYKVEQAIRIRNQERGVAAL